ncbi:hypothetical protein VP01_1044g2 [Puccinia sorghi]|uniref:Uncharacterized protein n=1 Tax=Puccinia sorghi TaxID=27349 RepID=A0A0L6VUD1_9BASI|nr:hypothetical protein VP01_1044g2 [Puccinia sorghi]
MDLIADFDLLGPLHRFLHDIGLLPLQCAPSTKISPYRSAGMITNHRLYSDIPPGDLQFLLNLVNVNFHQTSPKLSSDLIQDPVPSFLDIFSRIALLSPFTCHVSSHFVPILPELASRWILYLNFQDNGQYSDQLSLH